VILSSRVERMKTLRKINSKITKKIRDGRSREKRNEINKNGRCECWDKHGHRELRVVMDEPV